VGRARLRVVRYLDAIDDVEAVDRSGVPVPLAVHPYLSVVVYAGLEPDSGALDLNVADRLWQRNGYSVPAEREALGALFAYAGVLWQT